MNVSATLERVARDLHFGFRQLRKSPAFTLTAVVTLALGIGANTAVFSVLNVVLFRPLPFPAADRLVRVFSVKDGIELGPSAVDVKDFALRNHTFEKLAVYDQWPKNVTISKTGGNPEQQMVGLVPAEFFEALGIRPLLGRLFTAEENTVGHNHVALITESFWKSHFARLPAILGRTLIINAVSYTIVGVLPDGIPAWLDGPHVRIDIWEPFLPLPDVFDESSRVGRNFETVGLLKPGISLAQARADLETIAANLAVLHPVDQGYHATVKPLIESRAGNLGSQLFLLMGAVTLILLIACSNLASLLLARNAARQREFATQAALGASRRALVRQALIETLLLSWVGGGCGLALAALSDALLRQVHPATMSQLADLKLDWGVLLFTFFTATATSLLFGLVPALLHTRIHLMDALKQGGRNSSNRSHQSFRRILVAAQIALSFVLVVGASLMVQTIDHLQNQKLGFPTDHLMVARMYLPPVEYSSPAAITRFCDDYGARLRSLPGVRDASVTTIYFSDENWRLMFTIPGRPLNRAGDIPSTLFGAVDAHFLRTARIPLAAGRDFSDSDTETSPIVAIVNETFANRYLSKKNPIGQTVRLGAPPNLGAQDEWLNNQNIDVTVVGVMRDSKNIGLAVPIEPQLITLFRQMPAVNFSFKSIMVRSELTAAALVPTLEQQLHAIDPEIPLFDVSSMQANIAELTADKQFTSVILTAFAVLGVLLTVIGIYGVISYLVAQRTQELGIRLALGAMRADILWLILRQGLLLALAGVGAGLFAVTLLGRSLSNLLYNISPLDTLTLAAAGVAITLAAAIASAIPARRATRIDPIQALRTE